VHRCVARDTGERTPVLLFGESCDETEGATLLKSCTPYGLLGSNVLCAGLSPTLMVEVMIMGPIDVGGGDRMTGGAYISNVLAPSWESAVSIRAAKRTRSSAVSAATERTAEARGCADASNCARRRPACASPTSVLPMRMAVSK
jgi:hypothetical protein